MLHASFELSDRFKSMMVFGRDGQVGRALQVFLKDLKVPLVFLGRSDCDLSNELSIKEVLNRYQPQVIINAAAYTEVDNAESNRELAFAINAKAPRVMAQHISNVTDGIFVHYSTDYVFADAKQSAYSETDVVGPIERLCIYGQSKLAGELAIKEAFDSIVPKDSIDMNPTINEIGEGETNQPANLARYLILRTSWVYGDGENFIRTMLRLSGERNELKVVSDQVGAPTSAQWLAEISMQLLGSQAKSGIYHAVPDGETSWYDLALFVVEAAAEVSDSIEIDSKTIVPIPAVDSPFKAKRPYNSRLNNAKLKLALSEMGFTGTYPHWQEQVKAYVKDYVINSLKS